MSLTRRDFVKHTALAAAALQSGGFLKSQETPPSVLPNGLLEEETFPNKARLHWLDGMAPMAHGGTTWGVSWAPGQHKADTPFALHDDQGNNIPVQTWPLAKWPDGSLKWTAHAIAPDTGLRDSLEIVAGATPAKAQHTLSIEKHRRYVEVNTGVIVCRIPLKGDHLISSILRGSVEIARNGHLVSQHKAMPVDGIPADSRQSRIENVTVEQDGPLRGIVKIEGRQYSPVSNHEWLQFSVRLYFFAGSDSFRMMHTFIYDGDENKDFIHALGVRFEVPLREELHNRHVRFTSREGGLFGEAIRGITGLRRDPGEAVRKAQVAGLPTPPTSEWDERVTSRLQYVPAWGDYTLAQLSADGFEIRKRTKPGHSWIRSQAGQRAGGLGYIGDTSGGLVFGLRDFWQKYPTQLDIRHAHTESAELTLWLWSPDAPTMDMRFYHDGMGMDTYEKQYEGGLAITYEDYEPGFGTPHGIARTHELFFQAVAATPSRESFPGLLEIIQAPPLLCASPNHHHSTGVFGNWSLPNRANPVAKKIEDQLDFILGVYLRQPEEQRWYGFWDYGDIMHSYDRDRHCWRYDVGGFAWDNSELSPDLWLWYSYLRSGRADIFRFAEAMTRHTGEVDVYHIGRFKGLGSRHNVQHWGCSAKQLRISTAVYRRFYYYLTADERTGDLMHELVNADEAFLTLDPRRKIRTEPLPPPKRSSAWVGVGTDWGSLAIAWLTEWERTGDTRSREKLFNGMRTIGEQPDGFCFGDGSFNLDTGEFAITPPGSINISHLNAVFGLPEICAELIMLNSMMKPEAWHEKFKSAWLQYCRLYNAGPEAQIAETGQSWGKNLNLGEAHSRLTAYAAKVLGDKELAQRAWHEFLGGAAGLGLRHPLKATTIEGTDAIHPVEEAFCLSTNASAQWGLSAIECLSLIGDEIPSSL